MIKRLHLGRAAEGGVLAARLAQRGYEGPNTVIEGRYGLLDAFCEESDPTLLTRGLGETWEIERLCIKRYASHVTTHVPVQMLREFMEQGTFTGDDIHEITIDASAKVQSHHSDPDPGDIMLAQYSVPFCLAIAAYNDPRDPGIFSSGTVADARVRDLARRVRVGTEGNRRGWRARIEIVLRDGRRFEGEQDTFLGCPETPITDEQLRFKFDRLCQDAAVKPSTFDSLMRLEEQSSIVEFL